LKSDLLELRNGVIIIYDKCGNPERFKVKDEIDRLPDKIDINPYIDELIYCIEKINATLFGKKEFIELFKHTEFLDKLVKEASIREGTPCIIVQVQDTSKTEKFNLIYSPQLIITYERFPFYAMEFVDLLNIRSEGHPL